MRNNLVYIFVFLSSAAHAQKIITDRPDQTESSSTIPQGSLQIEAGFLLGFTEINAQKAREIAMPTILWRYGVTKALELRMVNQFLNLKNKEVDRQVNGFSNLQIGAKLQLLRKESVNTEIAFISHLVIPTNSNELDNSNFGTINKLSISHELNKNIGLGYNVGYDYFGIGKGILTYSLALGISLSDKVGLYLEPYGSLAELVNHLANFDAGFTYLLSDNLQLDLSFGTGINHSMKYLAAGFSWNIGKQNTGS
jgi:Putative MetA-pathway of phenol degradation